MGTDQSYGREPTSGQQQSGTGRHREPLGHERDAYEAALRAYALRAWVFGSVGVAVGVAVTAICQALW